VRSVERGGAPRVALVIGQLSAGGAESQLRLLASAAVERRFVPLVYCLSERVWPHGEALRDAGVPLRVIGGGRLQRLRALRAALDEDRIDIVHAWLFVANAYAWLATAGRPLVTSARNCKRQGRVLDALNRRAFAASAAIVVNSRLVGDYIARVYGAPRRRLRVVLNGIDLERFSTKTTPLATAAPTIVGIGRLVAQKNPALFVAAAAALRRHVAAARFRWIGSGPLRAQVARQIEAAGLGDCCVLEGERGDVEAALREADLLWLTSDWEGLPNVVMEAMATGVPVVATDVGGTRELFTSGREGILVAPGDLAGLVEGARQLLSDPAAYARAAAAARVRARDFAAERMVRNMEAVYREARGARR